MKPPRNEHAKSLHMRAGNAGTAISVDTRPKVIKNKKKANRRKTIKQSLKKEY